MVTSLVVLLGACSHARIPYNLAGVASEPEPIHPRRIAVLPFRDARTPEEGPDGAGRFTYRGMELAHTDLDDLVGSPLSQVTEIVGRHLARSHTFAQVILVESLAQAPEADLVLIGRVPRIRGYVEADEPPKSSGRPKNERYVLAEVVLSDVEILDAKTKQRLFSVDVGWSLEDKRSIDREEIDPWQVLGEALFKTVSDLILEMREADLSGGYVVQERVDLDEHPGAGGIFGALDGRAPNGWRFVRSTTVSEPSGWKGAAPRCEEARLEQKQTLRFHRVLGPYRPSILIWACPGDSSLSYDALEEFPARYLGRRANGAHYFVRSIGQTNWPDAIAQIGRHLEIEPPKDRYVFRIPISGTATRSAGRSL
jgi:hypothetical protein